MEQATEGRKTLAEFSKNSRGETVRIGTSNYKGLDLIDVRVWYSDADGELKPSGKGFAVKREQFPDLLEAMVAAAEALQVEGPAAKPGEWKQRVTRALETHRSTIG
jgi:hypothetical protein